MFVCALCKLLCPPFEKLRTENRFRISLFKKNKYHFKTSFQTMDMSV